MQSENLGIDWGQAPEHARWWAMDEDGLAHWYCMPKVASRTRSWHTEDIPAPCFGYAGDYKLSLIERPPMVRKQWKNWDMSMMNSAILA